MDLQEKLAILTDAAKYDVACTSSCSDRAAKPGQLGATEAAGICHSFSADGRCITLLKVLYSNACVYDCAYCINRRSNEVPRASFTPRELADLTIGFYRRNYIEGLFLSSGVLQDPDHTTELIIETMRILREEYGFRGYLHAKAIPGCSPALLDRLGALVDRLSINIELPSESSLKLLAPDKGRADVLKPMHYLSQQIKDHNAGTCSYCHDKTCKGPARKCLRKRGNFAPAGQSTQMIIGATPETDLQILRLSSSLYEHYDLKRVFYSAYLSVNHDPLLPELARAPLRREHRLYQADWLVRKYGFKFNELVNDAQPFLDPLLDPKEIWALDNLDLFPLEVNTAPFEMLLRIPGIGEKGARKIYRARKQHALTFDDLKHFHIALNRAQYFITCGGRYREGLVFDGMTIYRALVGQAWDKQQKGKVAGQMSMWELERPQDTLVLQGILGLDDKPRVPLFDSHLASARELEAGASAAPVAAPSVARATGSGTAAKALLREAV